MANDCNIACTNYITTHLSDNALNSISCTNINNNFINYVSFISFNMHGLSQGILELHSLCEQKIDVIFLQELWLTSDAIYDKLSSFNDNYFLFASSAMDTKVNSGLLVGRPYNGLCTLIRKETFCKFHISCVFNNDNCIIISADDILLINVYLPSTRSSAEKENLHLVLDSIVSPIEMSKCTSEILGGDLNRNVLKKS